MKFCVYTSLVGAYEPLNEQPMAAASGVEFICFTDDPRLTSDSWTLRPLRPRLPADAVRSSRWVKCSPHVLLADFDASLYIDNTVVIKTDPLALFDRLLKPGEVFACFRHSYRQDIAAEAQAVKEADLDAWYVVDEQLRHYADSDPQSLAEPALWSGILARLHRDPKVVDAMTLWWEHILRYSRRDQLSIQTCLRAAGVRPGIRLEDLFDSAHWSWPVREWRAPRPYAWPGGPEGVIATLLAERAA